MNHLKFGGRGAVKCMLSLYMISAAMMVGSGY